MLDRFAHWIVGTWVCTVVLWRVGALFGRFNGLTLARSFGMQVTWRHLTGERSVNDPSAWPKDEETRGG
jgi:hypothetical protein